MKIVFNNACIRHPLTGIGHLTLNNLKALEKIDQIEIILLENHSHSHAHKPSDTPLQRPKKFPKLRKKLIQSYWVLQAYSLLKKFKINKFCKQNGCDVYLEPNYLVNTSFKPSVSYVYDLSTIRLPEFQTKNLVLSHHKRLKQSIHHCDAILTISEFSKQEIIDVFDINPEKIFVALCATSQEFKPRSAEETAETLQKLNLNYRNFILVTGTFEPRKNLKNVCLAYSQLPENLRAQFPLVLCGASGWGNIDLNEEVKALIEQGQIRILNYIDDQTLHHLTASARVACYCSIYEGFGLPVLEAMQSHTPIITSNVSSMPEVAGDAGILVNPLATQEIAKAMEKVLMDDDLFTKLQTQGLERAKLFTIENSAKTIVKACEYALKLP
jgi:glycosyltransferase involved in cell wall biosynthesis